MLSVQAGKIANDFEENLISIILIAIEESQ